MEGVGDRDEVRGLVGGVGGDRTGHHAGLVREDRNRVPAEIAERADDRPAEAGLHLEHRARVEDDVDHLVHVVDAPAVDRDDVEDLGQESRCDVVAAGSGGVRPRGRGEVAQVVADEVERGFVGLGDVVDEAAGDRDVGAAEILLGDRLAE